MYLPLALIDDAMSDDIRTYDFIIKTELVPTALFSCFAKVGTLLYASRDKGHTSQTSPLGHWVIVF